MDKNHFRKIRMEAESILAGTSAMPISQQKQILEEAIRLTEMKLRLECVAFREFEKLFAHESRIIEEILADKSNMTVKEKVDTWLRYLQLVRVGKTEKEYHEVYAQFINWLPPAERWRVPTNLN